MQRRVSCPSRYMSMSIGNNVKSHVRLAPTGGKESTVTHQYCGPVDSLNNYGQTQPVSPPVSFQGPLPPRTDIMSSARDP